MVRNWSGTGSPKRWQKEGSPEKQRVRPNNGLLRIVLLRRCSAVGRIKRERAQPDTEATARTEAWRPAAHKGWPWGTRAVLPQQVGRDVALLRDAPPSPETCRTRSAATPGPESPLTAAAQELGGTRPVTVTQAGWAGGGYAGVSGASAPGTTPTTTTAPAPRWSSTDSSDYRAHQLPSRVAEVWSPCVGLTARTARNPPAQHTPRILRCAGVARTPAAKE